VSRLQNLVALSTAAQRAYEDADNDGDAKGAAIMHGIGEAIARQIAAFVRYEQAKCERSAEVNS